MDGDVAGTPAYMPPEQALGNVERLSPRSDVYAIGAMLYHLLARHMPYVPSGRRMTMRLHLETRCARCCSPGERALPAITTSSRGGRARG